MKFQGKIAPWWYIIIAFFNLLTVGFYATSGINGTSAMYIPLLIIVDLFMIPVLFKNYVTVDKDYVTVYFGLIKKAVPTKQNTRVKQQNDLKASYSASFDRIAIESKTMDLLYISIHDKQGFLRELMKVNKGIKYIVG